MRARSTLSRSVALAGVTAVTMILVSSCGSGSVLTGGDGGGEGGMSSEAGGNDGPVSGDGAIIPLADAPFACGKNTCRVDQYCLQPCCGGAAPQCIPANDAGGCPSGFHTAFCQGSGAQGCQQDACTPPPAQCIDDPSTQAPGCQLNGSSRSLICLCA